MARAGSSRAAIADVAASPTLYQSVVGGLSSRVSAVTAAAGRVYTRALPLVNTAVDFAWFAGSTALLVSLPILIELQRETTVLVLQRQREVETRMTFEQAKQMNPGIIDQAKGVLSMVTGRPLEAPPLPQ